ncbi:hypothetical protein [Flavisolibacter tropicus]|uniref:hypothetical protein n=1 Tax=Flavisolibacter tropicus TaxID=1492898 RepID=UPI0011E006F4|nr:hypothetical protein [Flavisolibacter tropicus]
MTRLFSINITFHQQLYTALVSIWQEGRDSYCQVRYTDKDLQSLLPDGKLVFNLAKPLATAQHFSSPLTDELINCTNKAISEYLHLKAT